MLSLYILVHVHALTSVHLVLTVHVIVYVHVYVCTCCCVDLWLLCVNTGGLSVVFVHVQYMLSVVACPSPLLVDFVYRYATCVHDMCECFFPPAAAIPPCVYCEVWLWMSFYCTRLFVVHVSLCVPWLLVYFDYLCINRYLCCSTVHLDRLRDSYCWILVYLWLTRVSSGTRLMIWQPWVSLTRSRSLVIMVVIPILSDVLLLLTRNARGRWWWGYRFCQMKLVMLGNEDGDIVRCFTCDARGWW